jgi:hypothetical protein
MPGLDGIASQMYRGNVHRDAAQHIDTINQSEPAGAAILSGLVSLDEIRFPMRQEDVGIFTFSHFHNCLITCTGI